MKRFTETNKWNDPWYRKLSPLSKLLWQHLLDHCDCAGVVELDIELASFQIGEPINESHLSELGDRVEPLPNQKLWIRKFIKFQFGELKSTNRVHVSVIKAIQGHSLDFNTPQLPDCKAIAIPLECDSGVMGVAMPSPKVQVQVQVKEKVQEKEIRTGDSKSEQIRLMKENLIGLFNRDPKKPWKHLEESLLFEVVRDNPDCLAELAELRNFERKTEFFPKSISSLLSSWGTYLDQARSEERNGKKQTFDKPKSLAQKEAESLLRQAHKE